MTILVYYTYLPLISEVLLILKEKQLYKSHRREVFLQFHVRFPAIPPLLFPSESHRLDPSTIIPYIHSEHT